MSTSERPSGVELLAPAKVNLSLLVTGRRPDGYHELDSLMAPVSIFDRLLVEPIDAPGVIEVHSEGSPHVGSGEENICHRAARFFFEASGVKGGAKITVAKNIPVGAGMGGGSSDAASTILALEALCGVKLGEEARREAGFRVGADVPFFFVRGPAFVSGIGERVSPVRGMEPVNLVIVHPGKFLSTGAVYSNLTIGLTSVGRGNTITHFHFKGIVDGLANDLEASARSLEPEVGRAIEALDSVGAARSLMSGSGSAVFGLFPDEGSAKAAAKALLGLAREGWRVETARLLTSEGDHPPPIFRWGVGKR